MLLKAPFLINAAPAYHRKMFAHRIASLFAQAV